jgi:maleylpyruvate isomerase
MPLYGYFRSSASWRVRIVAALKGLEIELISRHLRKGEQNQPDYLKINPQAYVPALILDDGTALTQSLAICEYFDELYPEPPLLPDTIGARAHVRALAYVVACDIHPLQNLKILNRVRALGQDDEGVNEWAKTVIEDGLLAYETLLDTYPKGAFSFGETPTLADICLIPQLYNARRFGAEIPSRLLDIEAQCLALPAFGDTTPDKQPDAE